MVGIPWCWGFLSTNKFSYSWWKPQKPETHFCTIWSCIFFKNVESQTWKRGRERSWREGGNSSRDCETERALMRRGETKKPFQAAKAAGKAHNMHSAADERAGDVHLAQRRQVCMDRWCCSSSLESPQKAETAPETTGFVSCCLVCSPALL